MHALGIVHEHNRADRDEYVTVHVSRVSAQNRNIFEKKRTWDKTPYDLESVMHYPLMVSN